MLRRGWHTFICLHLQVFVRMYSKIVVGVDGSENAYRALDSALSLAEKFSSEVYVLFVVHIPASAYSYDAFGSLEVFNRLEQEGRQVLAKCEEVARGRGMTVHTELSSGDPAQRIIEFASACGAELIIVGSRGMGRLERLLMGSVAERVVRFAKSPVLIVK